MKYCGRHNQKYMDFLLKCPVCCGEKMAPATKLIPKAPKTPKAPVKRVKGPTRVQAIANDKPIYRVKAGPVRVRAQ